MRTPRSKTAADRMCEQQSENGGACGARRIAGSRFCFFHDPASAEQRKRARRCGGQRNRAATLPPTTPDVRLDDGQDVARLLAQTINQMRRGEIDPRIGNSIGYLAGLMLKGLERGELEKRLAALEMALNNSPKPDQEYEFERALDEEVQP
jgi:hypothetical protein